MSGDCGTECSALMDAQSECHIAWQQAQKSCEKLEAVKNHLNAVYKDESDHFPWSINPMAFNKLMKNLYEIVEGKDQTSEVKPQ